MAHLAIGEGSDDGAKLVWSSGYTTFMPYVMCDKNYKEFILVKVYMLDCLFQRNKS